MTESRVLKKSTKRAPDFLLSGHSLQGSVIFCYIFILDENRPQIWDPHQSFVWKRKKKERLKRSLMPPEREWDCARVWRVLSLGMKYGFGYMALQTVKCHSRHSQIGSNTLTLTLAHIHLQSLCCTYTHQRTNTQTHTLSLLHTRK